MKDWEDAPLGHARIRPFEETRVRMTAEEYASMLEDVIERRNDVDVIQVGDELWSYDDAARYASDLRQQAQAEREQASRPASQQQSQLKHDDAPTDGEGKEFDFDRYVKGGNPALAAVYHAARAYRDRLIGSIDELSEIHPDLSQGWMSPLTATG